MKLRLISLAARWPTTLFTICGLLLIGAMGLLISIVPWAFWIVAGLWVVWMLFSSIMRDRARSPHDQLRAAFGQPPQFKAGGVVPARPEPDELTHKARRW